MGYLKDTGEPLARACKRKLVEQGIDIDKIKMHFFQKMTTCIFFLACLGYKKRKK